MTDRKRNPMMIRRIHDRRQGRRTFRRHRGLLRDRASIQPAWRRTGRPGGRLPCLWCPRRRHEHGRIGTSTAWQSKLAGVDRLTEADDSDHVLFDAAHGQRCGRHSGTGRNLAGLEPFDVLDRAADGVRDTGHSDSDRFDVPGGDTGLLLEECERIGFAGAFEQTLHDGRGDQVRGPEAKEQFRVGWQPRQVHLALGDVRSRSTLRLTGRATMTGSRIGSGAVGSRIAFSRCGISDSGVTGRCGPVPSASEH